MESELFGFEKGAFTGATTRQQGRLAQADGGTLFLDEIGDLSLTAQAKLLRAVELKEIQPLGSRVVQTLDFRVVAATNRNLEQLAAEGKFRQDLLFRLNVVQLHIPPLRERQADIVVTANHFLEILSAQYRRSTPNLTGDARARLKREPWLGNARELRNVIERIFLFIEGDEITGHDIERMCHSGTHWQVEEPAREQPMLKSSSTCVPVYRTSRTTYESPEMKLPVNLEMERLRTALEKTKWNKSRAAELLRCSRMTVHRKVVRYALHPGADSSAVKQA